MKIPHHLLLLFLSGALSAALVSCQQSEMDIIPETSETSQRHTGSGEFTITAKLSDEVSPTRTSRDTDGKILWSPGDAIKIFSAGESAKFVNTSETSSSSASFKGNVPFISGVDENGAKIYAWAIYPYTEEAKFDAAEETISATLSSLQKSKAGTFNDNTAIAISKSDGLMFSFKNVCSGMMVNFSRNDIVSVTLRGGAGETLAGKVALGLDGSTPVVRSVISPATSITMTPEQGCFTSGTTYYILTLPVETLPSGYSLTMRTKDGMEATYTAGSSNQFTRSVFKRLTGTPLDTRVSASDWHQSSTQPLNEIWYTSSDGEAVAYTVDSVTGNEVEENIAPNENDGVGIVRFSGVVTEIDPMAFGEKSVTSVTLPASVETIRDEAFSYCEDLTRIDLPDGLKTIGIRAFEYCSSLASISLPDNLKTIWYSAFEGCSSLRSVHIPESVENLGLSNRGANANDSFEETNYFFNPFPGCVSLESFSGKFATSDGRSLICESGKETILLSFAPSGTSSYTVPEGVTILGRASFYAADLHYLVLPEGLTTIGEASIRDCENLEEIDIPSTVTRMGVNALAGCTSLTLIKIRNSKAVITPANNYPGDDENVRMWSISGSFFAGGATEFKIHVPSNLLKYYKNGQYWDRYETRYDSLIGENEFRYTVVTDTSPQDAAAVAEWSMWNTYNNGTTPTPVYDEETGYWKVTVANPIKHIPDNAFENCSALKSVVMPATSGYSFEIGERAFHGCANLESVQFGESYDAIYDYAFESCSLKSLTVPNTNRLGMHAFSYNRALKSVYLSELIDGWPENNTNPFMACDSLAVFSGSNNMVAADGKCLILNNKLVSYAPMSTGGAYTVPETVTQIGSQAMYGALFQDVILPDGLTSIGWAAFADCPNLSKLEIPASVTNIDGRFIDGSSSIEYVKMNSATPPTISVVTFDNVTENFAIKIPGAGLMSYGYLSSYQNWNDLKTYFHVYQTDSELWFHEIDNSTDSKYLVGDYTGDGNYDALEEFALSLNEIKGIEPLNVMPDNVKAGLTYLKMYYLQSGESITKMADYGFSDEHPGAAGSSQAATIDWVSLPNTVTEIGQKAFKGCSNLLLNPLADWRGDNLTIIGDEAFNGCSSMVWQLDDYWEGAHDYYSKISSIGAMAFKNCSSLNWAFGFGSGPSIGQDAFEGSSLPAIYFYRVSPSIEKGAFKNCSSLNRASLLGVTEVKDSTFSGCASLQTVTFSVVNGHEQNIKSFGKDAFYLCRNLSRLGSIDSDGVSEVYSLETVYYESLASTGLTKLRLPNLKRTLGTRPFGWSPLTLLELPGLESAYANTFLYLYSLEDLSLPSITSFAGTQLSSVKRLTLGPNVVQLRAGLYYTSTPLEISVYLTSAQVVQIEENTFKCYEYNTQNQLISIEGIYVPANLVDSYKTASDWQAALAVAGATTDVIKPMPTE